MGVYKKENGKWYCRGQINGQRYHVLCKDATSKEKARLYEEELRLNIRNKQKGIVREEKDYTFLFMMNKYVEVCEINNSDSRKPKTISKILIDYFGKNTNILSVRPTDIESFKKYMLELNKANATINRYLAALKRAYNIMIYDDLINYNPVKRVKQLIEDNKRNRYLSKEEWFKLKQELPEQIYNIVLVALLTGLRKSNVLTLRWEQIDFELKQITITKSNNKGKKHIILPMSNRLIEILYTLKPKKEGYLFINKQTNKPYTTIRKSFMNALKRANIKDFKFHDIRRTVGTWLKENNVDLRTIQNLLCHSDIRTTERYLSITEEANVKAVKALDDFIE